MFKTWNFGDSAIRYHTSRIKHWGWGTLQTQLWLCRIIQNCINLFWNPNWRKSPYIPKLKLGAIKFHNFTGRLNLANLPNLTSRLETSPCTAEIKLDTHLDLFVPFHLEISKINLSVLNFHNLNIQCGELSKLNLESGKNKKNNSSTFISSPLSKHSLSLERKRNSQICVTAFRFQNQWL